MKILDALLILESRKNDDVHLCLSGDIVPIESPECFDDVEQRIADATANRNKQGLQSDARTYYNGLLKILRRTRRRSLKFMQANELLDEVYKQKIVLLTEDSAFEQSTYDYGLMQKTILEPFADLAKIFKMGVGTITSSAKVLLSAAIPWPSWQEKQLAQHDAVREKYKKDWGEIIGKWDKGQTTTIDGKVLAIALFPGAVLAGVFLKKAGEKLPTVSSTAEPRESNKQKEQKTDLLSTLNQLFWGVLAVSSAKDELDKIEEIDKSDKEKVLTTLQGTLEQGLQKLKYLDKIEKSIKSAKTSEELFSELKVDEAKFPDSKEYSESIKKSFEKTIESISTSPEFLKGMRNLYKEESEDAKDLTDEEIDAQVKSLIPSRAENLVFEDWKRSMVVEINKQKTDFIKTMRSEMSTRYPSNPKLRDGIKKYNSDLNKIIISLENYGIKVL